MFASGICNSKRCRCFEVQSTIRVLAASSTRSSLLLLQLPQNVALIEVAAASMRRFNKRKHIVPRLFLIKRTAQCKYTVTKQISMLIGKFKSRKEKEKGRETGRERAREREVSVCCAICLTRQINFSCDTKIKLWLIMVAVYASVCVSVCECGTHFMAHFAATNCRKVKRIYCHKLCSSRSPRKGTHNKSKGGQALSIKNRN